MLAKRVLDLTLASLLLLLLAPLLALLATAVAATTSGGVLTRSPRAGHLDGRTFQALRFRTATDGRAAALGSRLRARSLDGLPQLVNVMRGEMSLVGPRPLLPEEAARAGAARVRLGVRPGMTGLWQVGGRSDLPWEEREQLDLQYAEEHWLGMDLRILALTVPAALNARGRR
ncbi:sugar transferase [Streptomyces sp. NPDC060194]|uniref:sugar transferase n=1 Tax=Streptomyces sp. NPDC060194 TaxID=3347069 RepID=UPI00365C1286